MMGILLAGGWWRQWDGGGDDWGYSVCVDGANNIIVGGDSYNPGTGTIDGHIWKYDSSGNLLWDTPIPNPGNQLFRGIDTDTNNNIYVCMTDYLANKMLVVKYTSTGSFRWSFSFGPNSNALYEVHDIWVDRDRVFAVGFENETVEDTITMVLHYIDTGGTLIRTVYWNGRGIFGADAFGHSVCVNSAGNPVAGGCRVDYPLPNYKAMLVEFSRTTGQEVRRVEFNPTNYREFVEDIDVHPSGDLVFVVRVDSDPKSSYVCRYTSTFSPVWQRSISSGAIRYSLYGVDVGPGDTVLVSGLLQENGQDAEFWIRKYNWGGDSVWGTTIDHSLGYDDWSEDCAWDKTGYVIAAGGTVAGGTNKDMLVYKLPLPPVGSEESGKPCQGIRAVPNPFRTEITISGAEGPYHVYDASGRLLFATTDKRFGGWLEPGVYFIGTKKGMIRVIKIR
ncbi:MAG: hypothetical protein ABIN66_06690 [candidate division WOR-3 bacterium]